MLFCCVVLYVSMSIHSEWRGVWWEWGWGGLGARAEGEAPTHQSERTLCTGWSAVRREGENPSHTEDTRASRNPCPHINNPRVHLFKPENFWTSWISSRPHSLGQVTSKKVPLLCFLLETIRNHTELQTPLEHGIQKPGQALCCSHFHPSLSGLALWGGTVGIPEVFCYNWPHLLAHCLCMLCSSQKLALN